MPGYIICNTLEQPQLLGLEGLPHSPRLHHNGIDMLGAAFELLRVLPSDARACSQVYKTIINALNL